MGRIREYSLLPVCKSISKLVAGRKWGLATNMVRLKIFDFLKLEETLEVRLWLEKISGKKKIYYLRFEWLRYQLKRPYKRVAVSELIFTCVKILDSNKIKISDPPPFLKTFLESMRPRILRPNTFDKHNIVFNHNKLGNKLKDYTNNPRFLLRRTYETSLEDSNFIGNIYFATYSKWASSVQFLFFHKVFPDLFRKSKIVKEFMTLECKARYFNEAMPFDIIEVNMYLLELYEKGLIVSFDFLNKKGSSKILLAKFNHALAYVSFMGVPAISKMPVRFYESLR